MEKMVKIFVMLFGLYGVYTNARLIMTQETNTNLYTNQGEYVFTYSHIEREDYKRSRQAGEVSSEPRPYSYYWVTYKGDVMGEVLEYRHDNKFEDDEVRAKAFASENPTLNITAYYLEDNNNELILVPTDTTLTTHIARDRTKNYLMLIGSAFIFLFALFFFLKEDLRIRLVGGKNKENGKHDNNKRKENNDKKKKEQKYNIQFIIGVAILVFIVFKRFCPEIVDPIINSVVDFIGSKITPSN